MNQEPKDRSCPICYPQPMGLSHEGWIVVQEQHDRGHTKAAAEWETRFDEKWEQFRAVFYNPKTHLSDRPVIVQKSIKEFISQLLKETQDNTRRETQKDAYQRGADDAFTQAFEAISNTSGYGKGDLVPKGRVAQSLKARRDRLRASPTNSDTITNQNKSEV